jgi:PPOX class probable FMN-dependent enzyme
MIESLAALRQLYPPPGGRAVKKRISLLEKHSKRFIELSPFLVIASTSRAGHMDASPRGGEPGFVKVLDDRTLAIPDSPGNNRLDTLENILETRQVGLIFFIPGVDETLRVNGGARLNDGDELRQQCADAKRMPKVVIEVAVRELYLHCAKALMRSSLWSAPQHTERPIPTILRMVSDQIGYTGPLETQEQMLERYRKDL